MRTVLEVAVSLGKVGHEEVLDQRSCVLIEIGGERNFSLENVSVDSHRVLIIEGVNSSVHLVDENSESPPVDCLSVALVEDDLGSDVFGGSADGEGSSLGEELGEPEVGELEVAVVADEEVFGLEVPEDDVLGVQVFEAGCDDGPVEAGLVGGEGFDVSEVGEELSAVDEFEDKIEVSGILGESFEGDDEGVADLGVDEIFIVDVIYLLGLHDLVLVEQLEGNVFAGLLVLGNLDFAEAACMGRDLPLPSTRPTS